MTATAPPAVAFDGVEHLAVDQLHPFNLNPRVDLGNLDDLATSIQTHGIIEPLVVAANGLHGYTVVAGHRRLAAAVKAGMTRVPCIHRAFSTSAEMIEVALIENLQRRNLDPFDEARGFRMLIDRGLTQRQIADRVGCNQSHVSRRLALLGADQQTVDAVRSGEVTIREAEQTVRPPKPKAAKTKPSPEPDPTPEAEAERAPDPDPDPTPEPVNRRFNCPNCAVPLRFNGDGSVGFADPQPGAVNGDQPATTVEASPDATEPAVEPVEPEPEELVFGQPVDPDWKRTPPWGTYVVVGTVSLCKTVAGVNDPTRLLHAWVYEHLHERRTKVLDAIRMRLLELEPHLIY